MMNESYSFIDEVINNYIWNLINDCVNEFDYYIDLRHLAFGDHPDFITTKDTVIKSSSMRKKYILNKYMTREDFKSFIKKEIKECDANVVIFEQVILDPKGELVLYMRIGKVDDLWIPKFKWISSE